GAGARAGAAAYDSGPDVAAQSRAPAGKRPGMPAGGIKEQRTASAGVKPVHRGTTLELRQVRYFVRVVELGSMNRAAMDLGVVQSALSQQISRLESELSVRLLLRTRRGVSPTEAGLAF